MMKRERGAKGVSGKERWVRSVGDRKSRVDEPGREKTRHREKRNREKETRIRIVGFHSFEVCLASKGDIDIFIFCSGFFYFLWETRTRNRDQNRSPYPRCGVL